MTFALSWVRQHPLPSLVNESRGLQARVRASGTRVITLPSYPSSRTRKEPMRNRLAVAATAIGLVACTFALPARAADDSPVKFKKITLSDKFYSEGATAGDFNHDGKMDYAAGGWWYEGPDFKKSHRYYEGDAVSP